VDISTAYNMQITNAREHGASVGDRPGPHALEYVLMLSKYTAVFYFTGVCVFIALYGAKNIPLNYIDRRRRVESLTLYRAQVQQHLRRSGCFRVYNTCISRVRKNATPGAIKRCHFYFYDNFGKCGPISIFLSLLDS